MPRLRLNLPPRAGLLAAWLALAPLPALAQAAEEAAAPPATLAVPEAAEMPAEARLLSLVTFWRAQNRPEFALHAMRRLLSLQPRDIDFFVQILLDATEASVQVGDDEAARAYRDRMASFIAADDPRLARADAALRFMTQDTAPLIEARRLFEAGQPVESLAQYRELMAGGEVPALLAPEYFVVLAASSAEGYEEATEALEQRVAAAPNDLSLQLTYAQVLILREGRGRNIGLGMLQELSHQPAAAERARQLWRQALLWSGPSRMLRDQMEAYLADNPSDPELEAKQEELRQSVQDRGAEFKLRGFTALAAQNLAEAESEFQGALLFNPEDAEAVLLIGVVRMQQQRLPEGLALIDRAMTMAADREEDFLDQLGWTPGYLVRLRAEEDLRIGRTAAAEAKWAAARAAHPEDADMLANLAGFRLRQGKTEEARRLVDRAIALAPDQRQEFLRLSGFSNAGAAGGGQGPLSPAWQALRRNDLDGADTLARRALAQRQGDAGEAEVLLGQVALRRQEWPAAEARFHAALAQRPRLPAALEGLHEALTRQGRYAEAEEIERLPEFRGRATARAAQALALRDRAQQAEDPTRALELLQEATRLDPENIWVRLDLARLLQRLGRAGEARRTAGEMAAKGEPDALYAAALLASEDAREDDAVALLERIPAPGRSPDARQLLQRAALTREVHQLERQLRTAPLPEARDRLLGIAGRPDPGGDVAAEVMQAFARLQDPEAALAAARIAQAANPQARPAGNIRLASALLAAGKRPEAEAMLRTLEHDPDLTPEDRRQMASLDAGLAVATALHLTETGDLAGAYRQLARARSNSTDRAGMAAATALVHVAAGRLEEAEVAVRDMLARDPESFSGLSLELDLAMAQRAWPRAEEALRQLHRLRPQDPRVAMQEARLARLRGDELRALRALQAAERLQQARGTAQDPMARQIAEDLARARDAAGTRMSAGFGWRVRGGEGGRSRLNEFILPAEASTIIPGQGGRMTARVETVALGAGRLSGDTYALRAVGSNALLSTTTLARQQRRDNWAVGGALSLAYARGDVRVEVGSTPFGFRQANAVGMVEYAPQLANTLRLRLTAERLAVNDSVLSYAGLRDPNTGRNFGGVMRSGVRGQLEYTQGRVLAYAGGGYAALDGTGVAYNSRREANLGMVYALVRSPREELNLGLDLRYQGFARNLSQFSSGHGGYFSPEFSLAALVSLDWRRQYDDLELRLGASAGWQHYRTAAAAVFPHSGAMQGALEQAALADTSLVTRYGATSGNVLVGAARVGLDYALTERWRLGAQARYVRAATYYEAAGLVQARYRLNP